MDNKNDDKPILQAKQPEELFAIELDERLEFGVAIIESDLDADANSGCTNGQTCTSENSGCTNFQTCR